MAQAETLGARALRSVQNWILSRRILKPPAPLNPWTERHRYAMGSIDASPAFPPTFWSQNMKNNILLTLTLISGLCLAGLAHAEAPTTAPAAAIPSASSPTASAGQQAQENRMKTCAQQYHQQNVAKSQYHAFMSTCLKKGSTAGSTPAAAPATKQPASGVTKTSASPAAASQQDKMKSCNKDAKTQNLTGDVRKTFMQSCLSK